VIVNLAKEVMEMNIPGFTAEKSLGKSREYYQDYLVSNFLGDKESVISPAFRVTCRGDVALGALCTALGGAAFAPCFWNSGCMWFHAGLAFPPCFGCSFV
jgi:hypothetical protein